jgi:hypothetical protein
MTYNIWRYSYIVAHNINSNNTTIHTLGWKRKVLRYFEFAFAEGSTVSLPGLMQNRVKQNSFKQQPPGTQQQRAWTTIRNGQHGSIWQPQQTQPQHIASLSVANINIVLVREGKEKKKIASLMSNSTVVATLYRKASWDVITWER